MSEPENFLSRWSRRKRVVEPQPEQRPAAEKPAPGPALDADSASAAELPAGAAPEVPAAEFDPATLPSLDSIGAQTDIRAFLQAGVPGELRLAALRRAWLADPAIRDFKGMAEYDWDFTAPNSMAGFGEIDPGVDVKKMLAELFPETPAAGEPATTPPAPATQMASTSDELRVTDTSNAAAEPATEPELISPPPVDDEMVHREKITAVQTEDAGDLEPPLKRHGGALPQ